MRSADEVARTIDHALLKPEVTVDEVLAGCALAAELRVASVCCRPIDVASCVEALAGTDVDVGTVIGFPHGDHLTAT
ncbi:MAG: deoxyribose-phosphate aldolase, partial [Ilumatobacteraceae bacterium]